MQKQYACFSAAIRDGAKLGPQCLAYYFDDGATCAVGAGLTAVFAGDLSPDDIEMLDECDLLPLFPYLGEVRDSLACSECESATGTLLNTIYHLNDDHRWTRERIADWLYDEEEKLGFVTLTEALNAPEAGRGDSVDTVIVRSDKPEKVFATSR